VTVPEITDDKSATGPAPVVFRIDNYICFGLPSWVATTLLIRHRAGGNFMSGYRQYWRYGVLITPNEEAG
jgi:hypothetical protein